MDFMMVCNIQCRNIYAKDLDLTKNNTRFISTNIISYVNLNYIKCVKKVKQNKEI